MTSLPQNSPASNPPGRGPDAADSLLLAAAAVPAGLPDPEAGRGTHERARGTAGLPASRALRPAPAQSGAAGGQSHPSPEPARAPAAVPAIPARGGRGTPERRGAAGPAQGPGPAQSSPPASKGFAGGARAGRDGATPLGAALPPAINPEGATQGQVNGAPSGTTGRVWTLEFPAGLELLSMNGREHYMARHRKAQALKDAAIVMVRKAKVPSLERISLAVYYDPPVRRKRDHDNLMATYKHLADGIVKAGVVPDDDTAHILPPHCEVTGVIVPRGRLRIVISEVRDDS